MIMDHLPELSKARRHVSRTSGVGGAVQGFRGSSDADRNKNKHIIGALIVQRRVQFIQTK